VSIIREERIGGQRLILGDCLKVMPTLGRFDAVVTDPPYGIGEHGGGFRGRKGQNIRVLPNKGWDKQRPGKNVFDMIRGCADSQIIWGGNYFADFLPPSKGWLYWQKLMGGDFSDGELAWTSIDRALREFTKCPKGQGSAHPTQKPVALMEWCLGFLPDAVTILDPFMGSGTTLVACQRLGRQGTGIEIDPDYFDVACRRVDEEARQPRMFTEPPKKPTQEQLL
jgi:DNA modification methylase